MSKRKNWPLRLLLSISNTLLTLVLCLLIFDAFAQSADAYQQSACEYEKAVYDKKKAAYLTARDVVAKMQIEMRKIEWRLNPANPGVVRNPAEIVRLSNRYMVLFEQYPTALQAYSDTLAPMWAARDAYNKCVNESYYSCGCAKKNIKLPSDPTRGFCCGCPVANPSVTDRSTCGCPFRAPYDASGG